MEKGSKIRMAGLLPLEVYPFTLNSCSTDDSLSLTADQISKHMTTLTSNVTINDL